MELIKIFLNNLLLSCQGESSAQSESHKSDSEDVDGVEIEEEEGGHIVVDNNEPPCKLARKQLVDGVHCDGSSTDTELDGNLLLQI